MKFLGELTRVDTCGNRRNRPCDVSPSHSAIVWPEVIGRYHDVYDNDGDGNTCEVFLRLTCSKQLTFRHVYSSIFRSNCYFLMFIIITEQNSVHCVDDDNLFSSDALFMSSFRIWHLSCISIHPCLWIFGIILICFDMLLLFWFSTCWKSAHRLRAIPSSAQSAHESILAWII